MKKLVLLCLFTLILATALVGQQTTASINGTITDASGAVLPGAEVTVTNPATGLTRSSVTGSAGDYNIPLLPPGNYNMKVTGKGFASVQQNDISLLVGRTLTINQTLKAGGANEVVEVTSAPPMIDTSVSNSVGSVTPSEVSNLPIQVRNFAGLETLIPGVRQAEAFDPTKTRVGNISVNGGDGRQVDTSVDGGDNKDLVVGGLVQNFTMEGIQEFNVQTNRYTAEAGHSVAAVVNVVTKSGTNQIHGTAFGLFQNSGLNANNYFSEQTCAAQGLPSHDCKPLLHEYQYGGSVGGPIIKDKLFYFGAFEQRRQPGSIIVNPTSYNNLQIFASQTANFAGGPYAQPVTNLPAPYIDTMGTAKLDWNINNNNSIFFRYAGQKWTTSNDQLGNIFNSDGSAGNNDLNNFHDLSIQWTSTISPSKVNAYTVHFQDMANTIPSQPLNSFTYPVAGGGTVTNPNITFADGTTVGTNVNVPQETLIRKYQFQDVFSWTHGVHNMKIGGNWIYFAKMGGYFYSGLGYFMTFWDDPACIQTGICQEGANVPPALYPQGLSTPGAVREMFYSTGSGSTAQPPWSSLGLFFQDDWKVSPRLTLNLGIRWDANIRFLVPQLSGTQANSNKAIWDLRQVMTNPNFPANDPGGQTITSIVGNTSDLTRTTSDYKEFQPRVGFAWDITGTGKHLLRGGYGISRDQVFQNLTLFSIQQTQPIIYQTVFDNTSSVAPGQGACSGPTTPVNLCSFQFGVTPLPTPPAPTQTDLSFGAVPRVVSPQVTDPWSQQFGLGYAWQINNEYAFSADYVHILGTHEERVVNQNPLITNVCDPNYGGNPANPRCVNGVDTRLMDYALVQTGGASQAGRFAQMYDYSTNNRSFYDGITLALRKRMSKRFMFQASDVISWSRAWGGFPVASYGGSGLAVTVQQQFAPDEFNYTNFDERNRFVFSGVFNLPWGFSVNPIFTAASARPYSFLAGFDVNGDGRQVLDRVCDGSSLTNPVISPGCTMIKPNTLRGIPFVNMDLRVDKVFNLGERAQFYLYWEFFNLFNRANFCNSYEENFGAGASFNTPQSFCNGPSNGGAVSGFGAAAVGSFSNQFGFRLNF